MAHDGFSLDDKRQPVAENDIPDILACWDSRRDPDFQAERQARLEGLKAELAPLKAERLRLQGEINRLTFESVIAPEAEDLTGLGDLSGLEQAKAELADLEARIAPLQAQIDQLTRQFWVSKEAVRDNNYDLSASRYRQVEQDEAYYEKPRVTMERLLTLERVMAEEVRAIKELLG
jgi:type I restriction enzyme M protein